MARPSCFAPLTPPITPCIKYLNTCISGCVIPSNTRSLGHQSHPPPPPPPPSLSHSSSVFFLFLFPLSSLSLSPAIPALISSVITCSPPSAAASFYIFNDLPPHPTPQLAPSPVKESKRGRGMLFFFLLPCFFQSPSSSHLPPTLSWTKSPFQSEEAKLYRLPQTGREMEWKKVG